MTLIISQLVLIRRGGGRGGRRLVEKWRLVAGSRNVHAICNRKKARLTLTKDVPATLQAPEETGARSGRSRVDYRGKIQLPLICETSTVKPKSLLTVLSNYLWEERRRHYPPPRRNDG